MRGFRLLILHVFMVQAYVSEYNFTNTLSSRALKASHLDLMDLDDTTIGKPGHFALSQRVSPVVKPSAFRTPPRSCLVPPGSFFDAPATGGSAPAWASSKRQFRGMATSADAPVAATEADESLKIGAIGSKLTDRDLAIEALGFWVDSPESLQMEPTKGGVNNIVQYVDLPEGKKLLRIYNNGLDSPRVKFEHAILEKLNKEHTFPFKVPNFIKSKEGTSFVKLSNGAEACLCDFIDGELPKLTCVEAIGEASGSLCTAMGKLEGVDLTGSSTPHDDMWKNHHALTRDGFIAEMTSSAFDGPLRKVGDEMMNETLEVTRKCQEEYSTLPRQLIHADMHYDNILTKEGKVTGILDFEFAAYEWRAMELAICLSKYAGEADALQYFDEFIKGYAKTAVLTKPEAMAMPDLINLRTLSNIAYFVGRSIAKEDDISALTTRIENYAKRINWMKDNAATVQNIIIKHFGL